ASRRPLARLVVPAVPTSSSKPTATRVIPVVGAASRRTSAVKADRAVLPTSSSKAARAEGRGAKTDSAPRAIRAAEAEAATTTTNARSIRRNVRTRFYVARALLSRCLRHKKWRLAQGQPLFVLHARQAIRIIQRVKTQASSPASAARP